MGAAPRRPGLIRQTIETVYLTATNLSEPLVGIAILPAGKRKEGLDAALGELVERLFGARVLPFDQQAAVTYAHLLGRARASGYPISVADGQIAAIATVHGFTVATRDTAPFVAVGAPIINPWQE